MRRVAAGVALAGALLLGAGPSAATGDGPGAPSRERVVVLTIHHSRFSTDSLRVPAGSTVRFVVHNTDPIGHELIVGNAAVHLVHERGSELHHAPKPGEVSVAAGSTAETTYSFGRPGRLMFGCHLPNHWAYGMHGVIEVTSP